MSEIITELVVDEQMESTEIRYEIIKFDDIAEVLTFLQQYFYKASFMSFFGIFVQIRLFNFDSQ